VRNLFCVLSSFVSVWMADATFRLMLLFVRADDGMGMGSNSGQYTDNTMLLMSGEYDDKYVPPFSDCAVFKLLTSVAFDFLVAPPPLQTQRHPSRPIYRLLVQPRLLDGSPASPLHRGSRPDWSSRSLPAQVHPVHPPTPPRTPACAQAALPVPPRVRHGELQRDRRRAVWEEDERHGGSSRRSRGCSNQLADRSFSSRRCSSRAVSSKVHPSEGRSFLEEATGRSSTPSRPTPSSTRGMSSRRTTARASTSRRPASERAPRTCSTRSATTSTFLRARTRCASTSNSKPATRGCVPPPLLPLTARIKALTLPSPLCLSLNSTNGSTRLSASPRPPDAATK
jgi:hypothetical protein